MNLETLTFTVPVDKAAAVLSAVYALLAPAKTEPAKTEPAKTEPAPKTDPVSEEAPKPRAVKKTTTKKKPAPKKAKDADQDGLEWDDVDKDGDDQGPKIDRAFAMELTRLVVVRDKETRPAVSELLQEMKVGKLANLTDAQAPEFVAEMANRIEGAQDAYDQMMAKAAAE